MGDAESRHDTTRTLPWLKDGTAHLLDAVARCSDADLREPSPLPGWTRAHLLGHLARNAEALARLAEWARTGVETPMYRDPAQRDAEIDAAAGYPAERLRGELADTAADLDRALSALDDADWRRIVRSAQGRMIPATEIPWLRVREVWVHAVDLETGASMDDLPAPVVDLLLDDLTQVLSGRAGCPAVQLSPSDRDRSWVLGPAEPAPVRVCAPAARLAGWLTGRVDRDAVAPSPAVPVPVLPRWI